MLNAKLVVNGEELKLGESTLADLLYALPDRAESTPLLRELAIEGGSQLLEQIASRDCLDEGMVESLCRGKNVAVAMALLNNGTARPLPRQSYIRSLIDLDNAEVLETLVQNVEEIQCCAPGWVAARLAAHPDARVRKALANSSATPKIYLKELARDRDAEVRHVAKETLGQCATDEDDET